MVHDFFQVREMSGNLKINCLFMVIMVHCKVNQGFPWSGEKNWKTIIFPDQGNVSELEN